ncbi:MAG: TetM/TetW/TetO/TetS family tetracycline resistance ribosomal protection protein [Synergistaceae bacterium]|nr:TetM/TetW/TetO/TetS family tetracycline resistance ribosomal protection protein [Synergistaceae bacterium]
MDRLKEPRPLTIGLLAHVDGGKTTLTEQMLFKAGAVRALGRVDEGSAHTDFMDFERRRGISVRAASALLSWKGVKIYIIDTPGHSDFSGETQRAARAMDLAVIVVSAVEGVQPQTELIWQALDSMSVPALFFINKMDRVGADSAAAVEEITELTGSRPRRVELGDMESLAETLAEYDDAALERYLDGGAEAFTGGELLSLLREAFYAKKLIPFICGAALRGEGVEELLHLLSALARPAEADDGPLSGVVFKVEHSESLGRVAHLRLFSGSLKNRDSIRNVTRDCEEKVTQIREVLGAREKDSGILRGGEVGAVYGMARTVSGDIIGDPAFVPPPADIAAPMLRVRVTPRDESRYPALVAALTELAAEDPLLDVIWERELRELLVRVTGLIQTEILRLTLSERFGIEADTGEPMVIYRERPLKSGRGHVEYTMPKPCWAVMDFEIEPLPPGSGVIFESTVANDKIFQRYQAQVRQTIPEALRQGPRGWEVTDLRITLCGGEHHTVHTHPLDFVLATPMGIMDALVNCGTELLEPMLKFRLTFPEEVSGKLIGEIISMRGSFDSPVVKRGSFMMEGLLPLASSMDFPLRLASLSGGRAALSTRSAGYAPCPPGEGFEQPYRGVSPLDRAKYILYKRGALGV